MSTSMPDGSWLDKPQTVKDVLKFFISKLSPTDLEELDQQLTGESTATAMDARLGSDELRRDFLNYGPRDRKAIRNALKPKALAQDESSAKKSFDEMFPNMKRLLG